MLLVPVGTLESFAIFSSGSEIQRHKSQQCHAELGLMQSMVSLFLAQHWVVLAYSCCKALSSLYIHCESGFHTQNLHSQKRWLRSAVLAFLLSFSKVHWNIDLKKELLSLCFIAVECSVLCENARIHKDEGYRGLQVPGVTTLGLPKYSLHFPSEN